MWRASSRFVAEFCEIQENKDQSIHILCGIGNNGGDGLCIGIQLKRLGYDIHLYAIRFATKSSPDFQFYESHLSEDGLRLRDIEDENQIPLFGEWDIIIDAIFGTGLSKPIVGLAAKTIEMVNESKAQVFSVDLPSGLNTNKINDNPVVQADYTITFEFPKLCFFLPETGPACGEWIFTSIDLHPIKISEIIANELYMDDLLEMSGFIKDRPRFSHKGRFGHVLILGGSQGKMGAPYFSSLAAHSMNAGLVTAGHGEKAISIQQTLAPETMAIKCGEDWTVDTIPNLEPYDSIVIGPGLGTSDPSFSALKEVIAKAECPLVLDADALNLISKEIGLLSSLPANSVLTPHPGEFRRMFGESENGFDRLELLRQKAKDHQVVIILKDAFTAIALPSGEVYFNGTGNQILAHGGTGDVLAGAIGGLLASGYSAKQASLLAVFTHGLAADIIADEVESLLPQELADGLRTAWTYLRRIKNLDLNEE